MEKFNFYFLSADLWVFYGLVIFFYGLFFVFFISIFMGMGMKDNEASEQILFLVFAIAAFLIGTVMMHILIADFFNLDAPTEYEFKYHQYLNR